MVRKSLIKPLVIKERTKKSSGGLYFSSPKLNQKFIPTGCTMLDCVLGGGWALGKFANIVGDKSTGKTLLAMEAIANFCRMFPEGDVWYNESEAAFDIEYAAALGIPVDRINMIEGCATVEEFFNGLEKILEKEISAGLYILDSLDALSDEAELGRGIADGSFGSKAKKIGEVFRRLIKKLRDKNIAILIISQVRDRIGFGFGDKHIRSGGKSLDFFASQILWLSHMKTLERTVNKIKRPTGIIIRAKCKKNKVGLPFRDCDFEITFGFGIEDVKASQEFLRAIGKYQAGLADSQISKLAVKEWYAIEKTFLPERKKY